MKKLYFILAYCIPLVTEMHAMQENKDAGIENMSSTILLTREAAQAQLKQFNAEKSIAEARKKMREEIKYNITKQNELRDKKAAKLVLQKEYIEKLKAITIATKELHASSEKELTQHKLEYDKTFADTEKQLADENDFVERQQAGFTATTAILGAALKGQPIPKQYQQKTGWIW